MKKIFLTFLIFFFSFPWAAGYAQNLAGELSGRILLQVEENGEAWYVNPANSTRYYLGRPDDAFGIMRSLGVGITNQDLSQIPIGLAESDGKDTDGDGLPDDMEKAIGTDYAQKDTDKDGHNDRQEILSEFDPLNDGNASFDYGFSQAQSGKILLQIEENGEAWYVNPANNKRYYLGRPSDAFQIMRSLGLGISNEDLVKIPSYSLVLSHKDSITEQIHQLINNERVKKSLSPLRWNKDVAQVAEAHSRDLAEENQAITNNKATCDFPLIHHEGIEFGLYQDDRLQNSGVYDFQSSGENIALITKTQTTAHGLSAQEQEKIIQCPEKRASVNNEFELPGSGNVEQIRKIINSEIQKREDYLSQEIEISNISQTGLAKEDIARQTVEGWMNSPGHRENILDSDYNQAGIGVAEVNQYIIVTQVFIKKISCGYYTGVCCEKEGYYPYCLSGLDCVSGFCEK